MKQQQICLHPIHSTTFIVCSYATAKQVKYAAVLSILNMS